MKLEYLIQSNPKGEPVISVPLRKIQLELLQKIMYETINQLQDEYIEEDHQNFLKTKTEILRINKKFRYALTKLDDFYKFISENN